VVGVTDRYRELLLKYSDGLNRKGPFWIGPFFYGYMRIKRFADIIFKDRHGRLIDLDQYVSEEDSIFYESQADIEARLKTSEEIEKAHHLMELAWRSLTKRQKQVIILYFYANKTLEEIGEHLGISFQAVQRHKEQALRKMRKVILG